jgi:lysophospholipase L1-like esterase
MFSFAYFIFSSIITNVAFCNPLVGSDIFQKRADVDDFSWVKRFAAVGDSFTAGIGSGNLYSDRDNDKDCSRYDWTYPVIMNRYFGPMVEKFTYTACSGAITPEIYEQINNLDDGQDLVVLSAGGNDLCLVSHKSGSFVLQTN